MKYSVFKKHIQPTIVKSSDVEEIPENLRNRYFVNYNCLEMDWFENDYISMANEWGILLETDDETNPIDDGNNSLVSETYDDEQRPTPLDVPRVYFKIDSDMLADDYVISNFVDMVLVNEEIFWVGNENIVPGVNYFINRTLEKYLMSKYEDTFAANDSIVLENYLNEDGFVTKYWAELSDEESDYTNLDYYGKQNDLLDLEFDKDQLDNFYSTFCGIIADNSQISDDLLATANNQIYELVLNYFKRFKSDAASRAIDLILGSSYKPLSAASSKSSCACASAASGTSIFNNLANQQTTPTSLVSCASSYASAMEEYLKSMLGDAAFYADWMFVNEIDDEFLPDVGLIGMLRKLIETFEMMGYSLDFSKAKNFRCSCNTQLSSSESDANYKIISNYKKVLDWVENCQIEANRNKIKAYGEAFGALLPKLQL